MSKTIRFWRGIIKASGIFAGLVLLSLPEADFLYGHGFWGGAWRFLCTTAICLVPIVMTIMVCNAEVREDHVRKIRRK